MLPQTAFILVGGLGTRIRHLFPDIPKPLIPVCGRPFLYWILRQCGQYDVQRVVLISHYKYELLYDFLVEYKNCFGNVEIHFDDTPLGTGGALASALSATADIPEKFLLLNGDSVFLLENSLPVDPMPDNCSIVLFSRTVPNTQRYGRLNVDSDGSLKEITSGAVGPGIINTGVYVVKRDAFNDLRPPIRACSLESEIIPDMLATGHQIRVVHSNAPFIDIGTEASLSDADKFIYANFLEKK